MRSFHKQESITNEDLQVVASEPGDIEEVVKVDRLEESQTYKALKAIRQQAQKQNYEMQLRRRQNKLNNGLPKKFDPALPGNVVKAHHTVTKNIFGQLNGFYVNDHVTEDSS